ncbi:MAG TPA: PDZ domain-containing protein [Burkholderiaceae bacterium]|nr:PDZ domain-containing protein [Burkholderiaceae bacterium]
MRHLDSAPRDDSKGGEAIEYEIVPVDPHAHLFEITLTIETPDPAGQNLALPTWIPGSYLVREFARNIVRIEASSAGKPLALTKIDKHSWRMAPCDGPATVRYRVYAWDLSVRGAHLDATHGFFNGTSVFLQVLGQEREACGVQILAPAAEFGRDWRVATALPEHGASRWGFGRYRAADYDELIDHPVEMGRFATASFEAGGATHDIAITGRHDADLDRLCADLARICETQIALFEPESRRAPVERYLFLVMAVGDGYGGLEHRASTALICRRNDLPYTGMEGVPDGYRGFLGLASHEYFHTWHVKRIKPAVFADYDMARENYTRLLWIFEGFTSYYDDLTLPRAGVLDEAGYLKALGNTISSVMRGPGRFEQSVAESSFDAWVKYYRQDENAANAIVSYYAKGALVALSLDLTIRARSRGKHSLDDVMRLAWQRYGRDFYARPPGSRGGLPEDGFPGLLAEATGLRLDAEIRDWTEGTADLPLAQLFEAFGLELKFEGADHAGARLAAKLRARDGSLEIAQIVNGGPAHAAGLAAGDTVVAIDGLRVADENALKALLERRGPDALLKLHAFRRDELFDTMLRLAPVQPTEARLAVAKQESAAQRKLRASWLRVPAEATSRAPAQAAPTSESRRQAVAVRPESRPGAASCTRR